MNRPQDKQQGQRGQASQDSKQGARKRQGQEQERQNQGNPSGMPQTNRPQDDMSKPASRPAADRDDESVGNQQPAQQGGSPRGTDVDKRFGPGGQSDDR